MPIVQKWVLQAAISFVMRQLVKYGKSIDWAKVKQDLGARIADLIPGKFFDDEGIKLAHAVVDLCARVLKSTAELEKVLNLLADEKFNEALEVLKKLFLATAPETPAQSKFLVALSERPTMLQFAA